MANNNNKTTALSTSHVGARILLVDDDEIGREILTADLEEAGYCVSSARNGREAFDWVEISPPDLIISDVLRQLKSNNLPLAQIF